MTGGSSLWELQKSIYRALTGDAQLMAQIEGVFDFVPDNHNFPYVTIGEFVTSPFQTYDRYGQEINATIHVWTQRIGPRAYQGMRQSEEIMENIQRILVREKMQVGLWRNHGCWGDFSQTLLDPDGVTRHGILRLRFKLLQDYPN